MVEFAFVGVLLFTLVLGIIAFGMLLSVKNSVTQAANEGARNSVSVFARSGGALQSIQSGAPEAAKILAEKAAIDRMRERLGYLEDDVGGQVQTQCSEAAQCPFVTNEPSITYLARVHDCSETDEARLENFSIDVDDENNHNDCLFARVTYDHDRYPFLPSIPLIDGLLPETIADRADVAMT